MTNHGTVTGLECVCVCVLWQVFYFQRPHPLWEVITFAFLTQFEVCKALLVAGLVPNQNSLIAKGIKCTITEPQLSELLSVQ